jgi:curli biogenesis system outer membrane secretion channel CsgG
MIGIFNKKSTPSWSCLFGLALGVLALFGASHATAQITEIVVEKEGVGVDQRSAIFDAIKEALTQVNGAEVAASTIATISESTKTADGKSSYSSAEEMAKKIATATKGIINGYDLISSQKDPSMMGQYVVKVKVKISKLKISAQLKRLRLAVPKIAISRKLNNAAGRQFADDVRNKVVDFLTQTRKFAVMDRTYENISNNELDRLRDPNVKSAELARLGNKVGIDFIVVPKINNFSSKKYIRRSKLSGKKTTRFSSRVDLSLRVIDVATSQIKFSKNLTVRSDIPSKARLASKTARSVSDLIINSIFPPRVISVSEVSLTINQGGDSFSKGRRFLLYKLGKRLFDPVTRESLGREEISLGTVSVISATDRVTQLNKGKIKFNFRDALAAGITFIIRPDMNGLSSGQARRVNIQKEDRKVQKRINKMKKKAKDDW